MNLYMNTNSIENELIDQYFKKNNIDHFGT